jgi:predicted RNA binding protein YcfA (HicA-like mRNA interferase family)
MPKLRILSGRDVSRILAQNGFVIICQKGSHLIMQKKQGNSTITVPVPDHAELKTGTLLGIIRQSGLPKSLFETK